MQPHPEASGPLNALMKSMQGMDTVKVECQCGAETVMNVAYAQYVTGKLESCSACRK